MKYRKFGELDWQVPSEGNLEAVQRALESEGSLGYRVEILPGLNHLLQTALTGSPLEYGETEETMPEVAMSLIAEWILMHEGGCR